MYALLADLVLILHALIVAFVVCGLLLTVAGGALGWRWPRNFWFRVTHLGLVAIVAVQSWLGVLCPLTIWEQQLRALAGQHVYEGSFIEYWLHRIIFYQAEPWMFTLTYTLFGILVAATWWRLPPRPAWSTQARNS